MLPPGLEGIIFDKNGKPLTVYPKTSVIYNASGQDGLILLNNGDVETFFPAESTPAVLSEDIVAAARLFCDDMYFPAYIPEGFALTKIDDYKQYTDGDGTGTSLGFRFTSDTEGNVSIQLRYLLDKASSMWIAGGGTTPAQFVTINGHPAFFYDEMEIMMQIGDVNYSFTGGSMHDMLNMAYSLTLVEIEPED